MILKYIAGPLIGALIGFCTNFIAVKMLFYPKHEVRLFGHKLPFTPGVIPKGKDRLAKAVGGIIGTTLLTKEDIESKLLTDDIENQIGDAVVAGMSDSIRNEIMNISDMTEDKYNCGKEKIGEVLTEELVDALSKVQLSDIVVGKSTEVVKSKVKGTMLEAFLTDDLINSVVSPVGNEIQVMIAKHGKEYIEPLIKAKIDELEQDSALSLLEKFDVTQDVVKSAISSVFMKLAHTCIDKMLDKLDISEVVETKINAMSVDEMENLVLTVMKKELNTIVNLGALIGFILGILNIFF